MNLTPQQVAAAELMFNGMYSDKSIGDQIRVDTGTLRRWRVLPAFIDKLSRLRRYMAHKVRKHILTTKLGRVSAKLESYRLLHSIIDKRADLADPEIAGASTGLLMKRVRKTKDGEIIEYVLDSALCRELSRLGSEIAKEMHLEKESVPADPVRTFTWNALDDEERKALKQICDKPAAAEPEPDKLSKWMKDAMAENDKARRHWETLNAVSSIIIYTEPEVAA